MDINWDDEDLAIPQRKVTFDEEEDIFEFTSSLRIDDEAPAPETLPPLPEGVEDVLGDRGVLIKRTRARGGSASSSAAASRPSKDEPYVELHYEGFLVETGEKFDSSREQGYAMIVRLDLPPSGKSSLVKGWEVALPQLRPGEHAEITVAARYAYGSEGSAPDIPPDADLRFEVEIIDVRSTHKRVIKVDHTKQDLSRLEEIRRDREVAQMRREEESAAKDEENVGKVDRIAALREKLANKNKSKKGGKKGGKKKK